MLIAIIIKKDNISYTEWYFYINGAFNKHVRRLQPSAAYYSNLNLKPRPVTTERRLDRKSSKSFSNMNDLVDMISKNGLKDHNHNYINIQNNNNNRTSKGSLSNQNKENEGIIDGAEEHSGSFNRGASYLRSMIRKHQNNRSKTSCDNPNMSVKSLVQAAVEVTEITSNTSKMFANSDTQRILLLPQILNEKEKDLDDLKEIKTGLRKNSAVKNQQQTSMFKFNNLKSHFHLK